MSIWDVVGKTAMDAVDAAANVANKVQSKVNPLLEKSGVGKALQERFGNKDAEEAFVPEPEIPRSPFDAVAAAPPEKLGKADVPAEIFGRSTCPWTGRALQLLHDRTIEHTFVDLEEDEHIKLETQLVGQTGQNTVPYVFLRGEFIGGFNALDEVARLGQLEQLTLPENERSKHAGIRIQVAKRAGDDVIVGERGNPNNRK